MSQVSVPLNSVAKMKVFGIAVILFLGLSLGSAQMPTRKLKVQVLLGPLCPDSIRFVQNQLHPLYPDFKDHVYFTIIPYGKSNQVRDENGTLTYVCQHGEEACSLSRTTLCAQSLLPRGNQDRTIELIACQLAFDADRTGVTCANHVNLPFNRIQACLDRPWWGEVLMASADRMTKYLENPLTYVPTTTINWKFDSAIAVRARTDLKGVLCEALNNVPITCQV